MAKHYGIAVIPARARKPRDKAKVEGGVLIAERWILACLRNGTFFGLVELNVAISELLTRLNQHPFKKLPGCRKDLFRTLDDPAVRPLPAQPYALAPRGGNDEHDRLTTVGGGLQRFLPALSSLQATLWIKIEKYVVLTVIQQRLL